MSNWISTGSFHDEEPDILDECRESHAHGCPCRFGGEVVLPTVVIEANDGYEVLADVAP